MDGTGYNVNVYNQPASAGFTAEGGIANGWGYSTDNPRSAPNSMRVQQAYYNWAFAESKIPVVAGATYAISGWAARSEVVPQSVCTMYIGVAAYTGTKYAGTIQSYYVTLPGVAYQYAQANGMYTVPAGVDNVAISLNAGCTYWEGGLELYQYWDDITFQLDPSSAVPACES
jgi:hypothetical protein